MAYLEPKGKGDNSMPGKAAAVPMRRDGALRDPRDMVKAVLPKSQSPEGAKRAPAGKTHETGAGPAPA
jgi:hypothetical protein